MLKTNYYSIFIGVWDLFKRGLCKFFCQNLAKNLWLTVLEYSTVFVFFGLIK